MYMISNLTKDKTIYFLGIAGTAMASVAAELKNNGFTILGSDQNIYPPMSDLLDRNGVHYKLKFDSKNLTPPPDLVVVGNTISRGNVEIEEVLNRKIFYVSLPELIYSKLIHGHDSIVISGTHGKTTTTSLTVWIFETAGLHPDFLVGGVPKNFNVGCRAGEGKMFIIEGDEYDSAFFDKRSKFLHYHPDLVVINNIEFDHADIFNSIDDIKLTFKRLMNLVPSQGCAIVNGDDVNVLEVIEHTHCTVETFGHSNSCDWRFDIIDSFNTGIKFNVIYQNNIWGQFIIPLSGIFNVYNSLAAIVVANKYSIPPEIIQRAFTTFDGVMRRMEIVHEFKGITIIDDFAHHPTAIRSTLKAVRQKFGDRKIWALFEPRSNTTTRNIFQDEIAQSFDDADEIIIGAVNRPERFAPEQRFSPTQCIESLRNNGKLAHSIPIVDVMVSLVVERVSNGDVIVLLSNGSFGDAMKKIIEKLHHR